MIYFISGHRDITPEDFQTYYAPIIYNALMNDRNAYFVVGDCEGVDSMAQDFLKELGAEHVTVYHMLESPRYLATPIFSTQGGYKSDVERDTAMTEASNKDIAFIGKGRWTSGTAQNILRRYERDMRKRTNERRS
jgi:hypothetical protein